ncbi:hypothetical protein Ccrd_015591 [Cynara cardunculus var. scolymus]|uniref:Concanavalin A-like lectin/glucanase, subgroup n=1 Tax=Cynara cardunculus var. scolymus TaxID=59895 RepID=A0A118K3J6_CYNCS|nr:hypothetical protein Ccrd_015591 [Cynara cardunculus var. scolymus]
MGMNLFLKNWMIPSWVLSCLLLVLVPMDAVRPDPPLSSIADPVLPTEKKPPFSRIPTEYEAHSPGVSEIIVHHEDLNKKILVALIIASTLLAGILVFLFCFWIFKQKNSEPLNAKQPPKCQDASKGLSLGPILDKFTPSRIAGRKGSVTVIDYEWLVSATNNFHEENIVRVETSGHLYKARFNDHFVAAVKRLHGRGPDAQRGFEVTYEHIPFSI